MPDSQHTATEHVLLGEATVVASSKMHSQASCKQAAALIIQPSAAQFFGSFNNASRHVLHAYSAVQSNMPMHECELARLSD